MVNMEELEQNKIEAMLWDELRSGNSLMRIAYRVNPNPTAGCPIGEPQVLNSHWRWDRLRLYEGRFVIENAITGSRREAKSAEIQSLSKIWEKFNPAEFSFANPEFAKDYILHIAEEVARLRWRIDCAADTVASVCQGRWKLVPANDESEDEDEEDEPDEC